MGRKVILKIVIGDILEVDVDYPKNLFNFHKDLLFLPERKKLEKVEELVCGIEDKKKYVVHIRALKQALIRINTKKSTQSNSIQSKSMVKTIH